MQRRIDSKNRLRTALDLQNLGKLLEARNEYEKVLIVDPSNVDALHLLGILEAQEGKPELAIALISHALELSPRSVVIHDNLGVVLLQLRMFERAKESFSRAVFLDSKYALGFHHLSMAHLELGQLEQALKAIETALSLEPNAVQAMLTIARIHRRRGCLIESKRWLQKLLEIDERSLEGWNNLGLIEQDLGALERAETCFEKAIHISSSFSEAYNNLGANDQRSGNWIRAAKNFELAIQTNSEYVEAHFNLGTTFQYLERKAEAIASYRRALDIDPGHVGARCKFINLRQYHCDFDRLVEETERHISCIEKSIPVHVSQLASPFSFMTLPVPTTPREQLICARKWSELTYPKRQFPQINHTKRKWHKDRITIGYVSADFHSHATSWLLCEALENHDRNSFRTIAYSFGPNDQSETRKRIEKSVEEFKDVRSLSCYEISQKIYADEVDILVDLKGYTKSSRTEIFAYRPAPIQVNFLGFPGTMGAEFIDYIVVDEFILPPDSQGHYSEKPIWMPHCYQPNDSKRKVAELSRTREDLGLPLKGFVFCCFNNPYKITPSVFIAWMKILSAVPESVLWLLKGNNKVVDNLHLMAANCGIDPQRLVFADKLTNSEHLDRYRYADLFLDTFPVNAHTTASDALWLGLPVLTLTGTSMISRVAGSLLRTLNLEDMITSDLTNYQALAIALAKDPAKLSSIRSRLNQQIHRSPLFKGFDFIRHLEKGFGEIYRNATLGEPPKPIKINTSYEDSFHWSD